MANSRQSATIFSPSSKRPTKRTRSSITEHSFQGIASSPRGGSVTYVSGTNCHPCVGSLIVSNQWITTFVSFPPPRTWEQARRSNGDGRKDADGLSLYPDQPVSPMPSQQSLPLSRRRAQRALPDRLARQARVATPKTSANRERRNAVL